jgi:RimJ/RimL family protein N-acetyltransferase
MTELRLADGVVELRAWRVDDAEWYAETVVDDELIQRFTTESPTVTAADVRAAIGDLAASTDDIGFLICDAVTGERLGNIALHRGDAIGDVSYFLAAHARGRGAATCALRLLSSWALRSGEIRQLRLSAHVDNVTSRAVAERAGYVRDPARDQERQVKGATWRMAAYQMTAVF